MAPVPACLLAGAEGSARPGGRRPRGCRAPDPPGRRRLRAGHCCGARGGRWVQGLQGRGAAVCLPLLLRVPGSLLVHVRSGAPAAGCEGLITDLARSVVTADGRSLNAFIHALAGNCRHQGEAPTTDSAPARAAASPGSSGQHPYAKQLVTGLLAHTAPAAQPAGAPQQAHQPGRLPPPSWLAAARNVFRCPSWMLCRAHCAQPAIAYGTRRHASFHRNLRKTSRACLCLACRTCRLLAWEEARRPGGHSAGSLLVTRAVHVPAEGLAALKRVRWLPWPAGQRMDRCPCGTVWPMLPS